MLSGGQGNDIFVLDIGGNAGNGLQIITDFSLAEDSIQIGWLNDDPAETLEEAGLMIGANDEGEATVQSSYDGTTYAIFSGLTQTALENAYQADSGLIEFI